MFREDKPVICGIYTSLLSLGGGGAANHAHCHYVIVIVCVLTTELAAHVDCM